MDSLREQYLEKAGMDVDLAGGTVQASYTFYPSTKSVLIHEWTSLEKGAGNTERALVELHAKFPGARVGADDVTTMGAEDYWRNMLDKGLVDDLLDEHGTVIASRPVQEHPLLQHVPGLFWNGKPVTYNDAFRAVHDFFGHYKEGVGFRADGEDAAWKSHQAMYSEEARPASSSRTTWRSAIRRRSRRGTRRGTRRSPRMSCSVWTWSAQPKRWRYVSLVCKTRRSQRKECKCPYRYP